MKVALSLISILSVNVLFSQITIGKSEPIIKTIVSKPKALDSLKDWGDGIDRMSDYKKYIGADIYLPPYQQEKNVISYAPDIHNTPFIFTLKPHRIVLDTNKISDLPCLAYRNIRESRIVYNYLYNIQTLVYEPKLISASTVVLENYSTSPKDDFTIDLAHEEQVFNNYYTIIDVIYGEKLDSISKEMKSQLGIVKVKYLKKVIEMASKKSFDGKKKIIKGLDAVDDDYSINLYETPIVYKMINKMNGDTVFCKNYQDRAVLDDFVLVPYFIKQKEIYEGKILIYDDLKGDYGRYMYNNKTKEDYRHKKKYENDEGEVVEEAVEVSLQRGSKWKCEEVSILAPDYHLNFILSNDKGQTIALTKDFLYGFILEEDYVLRNKNKKLTDAENKAIEEQKKRRLKESHEKQRKILENKYGKENAALIINGKVDLNMTKEMCVASWGNPYNTSLLIDENMRIETFFYTGGYILQFENNKLIRIIK